jgi:hypothetical protein
LGNSKTNGRRKVTTKPQRNKTNNMITEEWKEQAGNQLSAEMAKRYAEANSLVLFATKELKSVPLAGQIKSVSPNGEYVEVAPEEADHGRWMPVEEVFILDVLVPMQEKDNRPKLTHEQILQGLFGHPQANRKGKKQND